MEHFAQLAEYLKSFVELAVAFGSFMGGLWVLWRKVSKAIDKYTTQVDLMAVEFAKLGEAHKILTSTQEKVACALSDLATRLLEREKDISKLEGAMDATRKDMIHLVSAIQQSSGSLDGLWRTLQTLFPNQVPRRASDK